MKQLLSILSLAVLTSCSFAAGQTADQSLLEVPQANVTSGQILTHDGYTSCFSYSTNTPVWTAWELTAEEASATSQSRDDSFQPDPDLLSSPASYDYSRSGFDRGHMAPAGDFRWSPEAMSGTFLMSNVCPQDHTLNAGCWNGLEKQCRNWAKKYGKVWICCGPLFSSDPKTIGRDHKVAVPDCFYKVVMKKFKEGWYAIGFIIPNEPLANESSWRDYAVSVDEVERRTGFDFFAAMPDDVEDGIESVCRMEDWRY